jgi:hypothetical protein
MGVYVRGKTVETDLNIYEFDDLLAAENFINCLCGMDEEHAKARVRPIRVNRKPQPRLWLTRRPG